MLPQVVELFGEQRVVTKGFTYSLFGQIYRKSYLFLKYLCEIKNKEPEIINIEIVKIIFNSISTIQYSILKLNWQFYL